MKKNIVNLVLLAAIASSAGTAEAQRPEPRPAPRADAAPTGFLSLIHI